MDSTAQTRLYSIWPPGRRTRQMIVDYILKSLTTRCFINTKYALLSNKEAEQDAKRIESESFTTANQHFGKDPLEYGSAVKIYADHSLELMLEVLKTGPKSKEEQEAVFEAVTADENTFFDISGGNRRIIKTYELAEELLKPLQKPGNKYTKIRFSKTSFGLDAACAAAPILSSLKDQLTEVDLSYFVHGRPGKEELKVIKLFSSALKDAELRYLNLSHNPLGEKGVRAFGELFKSQGKLEELCISVEAAKEVCELLPSTQRLKILHFHNDMAHDEGAIATFLTKCPILEDFSCSFVPVDSEGGIALAKALGKCPHLKKIDLRGNVFGVEAGIPLSNVISRFTNLTEIYVSYLFLENKGTLALVNALKDSASSLEVLEMAGNRFTAKVAPALAALVLAKKKSITKIGLSMNKLADEGAMVIAKALQEDLSRLTEVDLSTNKIRSAGARGLSQAVVGKKQGFKLLNINGNFLSDEGVEDVTKIFENSPYLLGPLDENDPEGEEYHDEDEEEAEEDSDDNDDELESTQGTQT
ncbi:Ran GTPase-activating protein 1 [Tanacetum coccineum]